MAGKPPTFRLTPERTTDDGKKRHRSHHRPHPRALQAGPRNLSRPDRRRRPGAAPTAPSLSCGNLAHGFAVCSPSDKVALGGDRVPNLGIITSYNDMLSAHQPFETYPQLIKEAAREAGGIAQVAGGVPAMCDGVTQGQPGMELSLFSRDVIAMATAVGAVAQHVRRGRLSRRLRQDRAGAGDRGADLRPSAGGVHPGRADDHRASPTTRRRRSASSTPKARSAAPNCWKPSRNPITGRAPAPSTAPPTPTRC